MFRRLVEWWRKQNDVNPARRWKVTISNEVVEVVDYEGQRKQARFADVQAIIADMYGNYRNTDWWILDGREGCILAFPWGAQGESDVVQFFQQLPGFDWDKLGAANRSLEDASFVVWKRKR